MQVFKLKGSADTYLFVKSGDSYWTISKAEKRYLRSGGAGIECPAHPKNKSSRMLKTKNWGFNKTPEDSNEDWEEGGVTLHCTVHDDKWLLIEQALKDSWNPKTLENMSVRADKLWPGKTESMVEEMIQMSRKGLCEKEKVQALLCQKNKEGTIVLSLLDFATQQEVSLWNQEATSKIAQFMPPKFIEWLFLQSREGKWNKEAVYSIAFQEDMKGTTVLSLLDFEHQKEVALWNKKGTSELAHLMSANFVDWLIQLAKEDKWSKEDVGSIVCRKNASNQLILATLDEDTQKEVAVFNKARTCSVVPFMIEGDFLPWLYQEAVSGRWDLQMVSEIMSEEEVNGRVVVSPVIKPGIKSENIDTFISTTSSLCSV